MKLLYVNWISKTNKNTSIYATDNLNGYRSHSRNLGALYISQIYQERLSPLKSLIRSFWILSIARCLPFAFLNPLFVSFSDMRRLTYMAPLGLRLWLGLANGEPWQTGGLILTGYFLDLKSHFLPKCLLSWPPSSFSRCSSGRPSDKISPCYYPLDYSHFLGFPKLSIHILTNNLYCQTVIKLF